MRGLKRATKEHLFTNHLIRRFSNNEEGKTDWSVLLCILFVNTLILFWYKMSSVLNNLYEELKNRNYLEGFLKKMRCNPFQTDERSFFSKRVLTSSHGRRTDEKILADEGRTDLFDESQQKKKRNSDLQPPPSLLLGSCNAVHEHTVCYNHIIEC